MCFRKKSKKLLTQTLYASGGTSKWNSPTKTEKGK
jgi:hypothetical protein